MITCNRCKEAEPGRKSRRPRLDDFDMWHKPCENCGYDPGKTANNRCWKCGRRVYRDFTDRALKSSTST